MPDLKFDAASIPATANHATAHPDAWAGLKQFTRARIALGRAGGSWQTGTLLEFRLAHALARDAVGFETTRLSTAATTRSEFLQRPDLGRRLSAGSEAFLNGKTPTWGGRDLAVLVSDGLSALAAERQIVPTLAALLALLTKARWTICPILIVPFARVKLQDQVGVRLQARHTLMLLGERPGLGSPDSLGAYFTCHPSMEKTDADRTCVSNIRTEGLRPDLAGLKLADLLIESARQGCSGIFLKEPTGKKKSVFLS